MIHNRAVRYGLFVLWVAIAAGALYLYFFQREAVQAEMRNAMSASFWAASISYLVIGALRSLTLVPATFPLLVAMPFFDPWVLMALTIPCIAISSAICYGFAEALHLDELVETRYPRHIRKLKELLQSYQLPIIIGWSFMLFLPTDVLCYVCGSLRINFKKFIVGVVIGEGAVYAIYIFLGDWILR
ncbi:MAG: VTT domain-containing protein [Acidimicrobiia bacterium]